MQQLSETIPEALGAVHLISADGGWRIVGRHGEVNADEAMLLLRAGEGPLFDDTLSEDNDEVEVVLRREELVVAVANARSAVVLRLAKDANIGMGLAYAHALVRGGFA